MIFKNYTLNNTDNEFWENLDKFRIKHIDISPFYTESYFSYQVEYCKSRNSYISHESSIFVHNDKPLCAYLFLVNKNEDGTFECNYGSEIPGLIFIEDEIDKKILSEFIKQLSSLKQSFTNLKFTFPLSNKLNKGYEEIIKNFKFTHKTNWARAISLEKGENQLWVELRKSYKSVINKGIREQKILLVDHINFNKNILKEMQELHYKVSGRITRSNKTWELQFDSIKKDFGFVFCSLNNKNLLAAVYFIKSSINAYYSVGIFTKEAKEKNYGHCLIWKAIQYCKLRGLKICELDMSINFNLEDNKDEKLRTISYFKSGFGGDIYPKYEISI